MIKHFFVYLFCRLPNVPRPRMSICILADAADIDRAKQIELEYMSVDDLKKCVIISSSS
jgi:large subunit ribosomal protein L10Ae